MYVVLNTAPNTEKYLEVLAFTPHAVSRADDTWQLTMQPGALEALGVLQVFEIRKWRLWG